MSGVSCGRMGKVIAKVKNKNRDVGLNGEAHFLSHMRNAVTINCARVLSTRESVCKITSFPFFPTRECDISRGVFYHPFFIEKR